MSEPKGRRRPDPFEELDNVLEEPLSEDEPGQAEPPKTDVEWRLDALEAEIRARFNGSLDRLRRSVEQVRDQLAALDKRTVNLELDLTQLRTVTDSLEASLRRVLESAGLPPAQAESPSPGRRQARKPGPKVRRLIEQVWDEEERG